MVELWSNIELAFTPELSRARIRILPEMGWADGDWGGWDVCTKAGRQEETTSWLSGLLLPTDPLPVCGAWGAQGGIKPGSGLMGAHGPGGGCWHSAELVLCNVMQDTQKARILDQSGIRGVGALKSLHSSPRPRLPSPLKTGAPKMPLGRMRRMDARQAADTGHCISEEVGKEAWHRCAGP